MSEVIVNPPANEMAAVLNTVINDIINDKATRGDDVVNDLNYWALRFKAFYEMVYNKGYNDAIDNYGIDVPTGFVERPHSKQDVLDAWANGNSDPVFTDAQNYYDNKFVTGL